MIYSAFLILNDVPHFLQLGDRDASGIVPECQSLQQGHLVNDFTVYDILHVAAFLCMSPALLIVSIEMSFSSRKVSSLSNAVNARST